MEDHANTQPVKIFTERLVEMNTSGRAMPDGGEKRNKTRDKAQNRTRAGLERVLDGKMAYHSSDGGCAYDS